MQEPKGRKYWYIDEETETWKIRDDAPDWAKEEFREYFDIINHPTIRP